MIWKLLMVHTGHMPHDDRDHVQNKRYQCSGPLLGQLFHRSVHYSNPLNFSYLPSKNAIPENCLFFFIRSLHALKQEMEKSLTIQIRRGKIDLHSAISPNLITNMLKNCLASGNWGSIRDMQSKNSRIYSNVTQVGYGYLQPESFKLTFTCWLLCSYFINPTYWFPAATQPIHKEFPPFFSPTSQQSSWQTSPHDEATAIA